MAWRHLTYKEVQEIAAEALQALEDNKKGKIAAVQQKPEIRSLNHKSGKGK